MEEGSKFGNRPRDRNRWAETVGMTSQPVLVAVGPSGGPQEFLLERLTYSVGRADGRWLEERLAVTGDPLLSRHHFDIEWSQGKLHVCRHPEAKNPLFFQGRERDRFELSPGQVFLSGKTRFELMVRCEESSAPPLREFTLVRTELPQVHRPNTEECFRALVELLPELRNSADETTAFQGTLKVLARLLPEAAELTVLKLGERPETLERRLAPERTRATPPSRGLLARAFEVNATVAHVWSGQSANPALTEHAQADWAVASPVEVAGAERFALYVVGSAAAALSESEAERQKAYLDDMTSLVDIVAETLGHHLAVAHLNRFEGQVTRFFSPVLRQSLVGREFSEVLRPTRREVTVMFFDLRGFSRATEEADEDLDSILGHHELLTDVMTAVTDCVFEQDGVVVDYQGDAVLACWGALNEGRETAKAVEAARAILERIYAMELPFAESGPRGLRCGIGLAGGEAIAGQIGAREQIKFGVLGNIVNLASRLEGLTRFLGVPILLDSQVYSDLPEDFLCRRIGQVRPSGVEEPYELFELVVAQELGGSGLQLEEVQSFEAASHHFSQGRMNEAYEALLAGSRPHDPVARFLTRRTLLYLEEGLPRDFSGVLEFRHK